MNGTNGRFNTMKQYLNAFHKHLDGDEVCVDALMCIAQEMKTSVECIFEISKLPWFEEFRDIVEEIYYFEEEDC